MKIFHMSDSHIGRSHFNEDSFNKAINYYRKNKFDLFIHSGDLTQGGSLKQFEKAKNLFKDVKEPKVFIPGNHDKRSGGISIYKNLFGGPTGVKEINDTVVIYIDSAVADTNLGRVGTLKYNFIKNCLKKYQNKSLKIIVLHHHILPIPRTGRERNVLSNAGDLLDLILRYDVDLVLLGHRHYPNVYQVEQTVFVNAGTVSDKKTRHGDVNSFNIINVNDKNIDVTIRRMNDSELKNSYKRNKRKLFYDFGKRLKRIAHISNSFISTSNNFKYTHFLNSIKKINRMDIDFVIHCGGIVERGIRRNYELAERLIKKLDSPVYFTPAGRDINYLGYHLFEEYFGDFDQSYSDEDFLFQGVSSAQYDSKIGIIGRNERDNILNQIQDENVKFKAMFFHHNVVPIPHAREKGLLEDSGDLLKTILRKKINLVLTGTSSHPFAVMIDNTIIVNANSVSSVFHRSVYGNSFNVIDIYEKNIVAYEINSLWGTRRVLGMWER